MDWGMSAVITSLGGGVTLVGAIFFLFICLRSKSPLPGFRFLAKKIIGRDGYNSELLANCDKKIEDISHFSYLHGLNYTSHNKLLNFNKRVDKYDLYIPRVAKSGRYFNAWSNKVVIKDKFSFIFRMTAFSALTVCIFTFLSCFGEDLIKLKNENHYLITQNGSWIFVNSDEVKASDIYFWKSRPSMKNWRMKLDKCDVKELSSKAGISEEFSQQICDIPSSDESQQYIADGIVDQRYFAWSVLGSLIVILYTTFGILAFSFKKRIHAHETRKYMYYCYKKIAIRKNSQ